MCCDHRFYSCVCFVILILQTTVTRLPGPSPRTPLQSSVSFADSTEEPAALNRRTSASTFGRMNSTPAGRYAPSRPPLPLNLPLEQLVHVSKLLDDVHGVQESEDGTDEQTHSPAKYKTGRKGSGERRTRMMTACLHELVPNLKLVKQLTLKDFIEEEVTSETAIETGTTDRSCSRFRPLMCLQRSKTGRYCKKRAPLKEKCRCGFSTTWPPAPTSFGEARWT